MQALVNTSFLGALQQAWKFDIWRSMIGGTCQHFHFGGATASLKNWHMTFHDWGHLSTLPFWGRYSKPEKLTYDVPRFQALVNTSVLGALQRALKIDIWRSMIASACQHFHFGGATASLKNWHMTFHDCGHFSTLPFWGRYNVPCLQALVNTSILGALQQAWEIDIWRSMIAGTCQHFHVFSPKLSFTPAQVFFWPSGWPLNANTQNCIHPAGP